MNNTRNIITLQRSVALALVATVSWTFALFPTAASAAEAHRIEKAHKPVRTTAQILEAAKKQEEQRSARMPHYPYVQAAAKAATHKYRVPAASSTTILDEVGKLAVHVSNSLLSDWRSQTSPSARAASPSKAAEAYVHIGEWELAAEHNPKLALKQFHLARELADNKSATYGLAAYDTAVAHFYEGAYSESVDEFRPLLNIHTALPGYQRQDAAMWLRHAGVCAAYHRDNALLGIPEPPKLDPFCGAASLAACLKGLHVPFSRPEVLKVCRVNGEGSNAQDLLDAANKLGLDAQFVGANEKGLINLPKPVVAFVERDHFVAVTKADAKGVSYLCSDCGVWPGGQVDLTWQQWRALNPGLYVTVAKPGSSEQARVTDLLFPNRDTEVAYQNAVSTTEMSTIVPTTQGLKSHLASWSGGFNAAPTTLVDFANGTTAREFQFPIHPLMKIRAPFARPDVILTQTPAIATSCGTTASAQPCKCVVCCPKESGPGDSGGSGDGKDGGSQKKQSKVNIGDFGPSAGDPVNLATGQEEYTPAPDITVYNPHGPSISWSRIYSSLRPGGSAVNVQNYYQDNDYGVGWSQTYNVSVYDPSNGGTGSGNQKYIVFPNGSRAWFTASAQPTAGHPVICTVEGGFPLLVEWDYDSTGGSLGHYTITFQDRTKWITSNIVTTSSIYSYPLAQITDRNGNSIYFNYSAPPSGMPWPLLSNISTGASGTGTVLLNVVRTGDGSGSICVINDCYGRSVYYHVGFYANVNVPAGYPQSNPELDHVSQIVASCTSNPPDRYSLGYQTISNLEGSELVSAFLHTITVPSPTGSGLSTATINYDPVTDFVSSIVDANGNQKIFTSVSANGASAYPSNYTKTVVKDVHNNTVYTNTAGYDTNMSQTSRTDGAGRIVSSAVFSDPNNPYRPSQSRNGIAAISIPQGGSLALVANGTASPASSTWDILNPAGTIIATSTTPGSPAWSVVYVGASNRLTVVVPFNAPINSGYTVRYAGGGSAIFNVTSPGSNYGITSYTWDPYGNLLTHTTPRGITQTNTYSYSNFVLGELVQKQIGTKTASTYSYYEPSGLLASYNSPLPGTVGMSLPTTPTLMCTYDTLGNVTSVTTRGNENAATISTTFEYQSDPGDTTYSISPYSQSAAISQPIRVTDNLGHSEHLRYDLQGNRITAIDAKGNEKDTQYTIANDFYRCFYPRTGQTGTGQACNTNVYVYPGGPLIQNNSYDESGSLSKQINLSWGLEGEVVSRMGGDQSYAETYDSLYRVTGISDGNGHMTSYTYNTAGYVASKSYPGGGTMQYPLYDVLGNVLRTLDGRGVETDYLYNDPESLLTDIQYPASTAVNVHFTYDVYGRKSVVSDGSGTTTYGATGLPAYDDSDNPINIVTSYHVPSSADIAATIGYSYNPNGSCHSLSTPAGVFTYGYDASGRETSLVNPFGESTSWTWDINDLLISQRSSKIATTYTRNATGSAVEVQNTRNDGTNTVLTDYSGIHYDGATNVSSVVSYDSVTPAYSGNTAYTYDSRSELTNESSTQIGGYSNSYVYDGAGNATQFKSTSNIYNSNNQESSNYDGEGNPLYFGAANLTFDAEDRLTQVGSALTSGYRYDDLRAWKQSSVGRTYFVYNGEVPVCELDSAGAVQAVNTFGAVGLISRHTSIGSTYYAFDIQGNTTIRMNSAGTVLDDGICDAFGASSRTASTTDPYAGYGARNGYYKDWETGLELLTFRYYDPSRGRFLTRDPVGFTGGINPYCYVGNRPITHSDSSGLAEGSGNGGVIGGCLASLLPGLYDTYHSDGCEANYEGCEAAAGCAANLAAAALTQVAFASVPALEGLQPLLGGCLEGMLDFLCEQVGKAACKMASCGLEWPKLSPCQVVEGVMSMIGSCVAGGVAGEEAAPIKQAIAHFISDTVSSQMGQLCDKSVGE